MPMLVPTWSTHFTILRIPLTRRLSTYADLLQFPRRPCGACSFLDTVTLARLSARDGGGTTRGSGADRGRRERRGTGRRDLGGGPRTPGGTRRAVKGSRGFGGHLVGEHRRRRNALPARRRRGRFGGTAPRRHRGHDARPRRPGAGERARWPGRQPGRMARRPLRRAG